MPSLGADMESGTLLEWLVHPGDTVHRGDPVAVVDTDKAAIEIESFDEGTVATFLVEPGTRVAVGTPIATITADGGAPRTPAAPPPAGPPPAGPPPAATARVPRRRAPRPPPPLRHHAAEVGVDLATVPGTGPAGAVTRGDVDRAAAAHGVPAPAAPARRVSPYARRLAHELGVDLAGVRGSGPAGSVRAEDVRAAVPAPAMHETVGPAAAPAVARGPSRETIAALMSRANRDIPHYYVATTADMQAVTTWLRKANRDRPVSERIVPAAAILKAAALAARAHPELNGFWTDGAFVPAADVHLGVAVRVRHGALVAPAIHGAADLDLVTLMQRLRDLVSRARNGRLTRAEVAEPTLTVTDLGDQGVEEVMGVIYPPQVALLGVGRMVDRPWAVEGMLTVRPVVRLTLSGDHRATDGATGAHFLAAMDRLLQNPEELQ